jgi:dUTP pyrophosphatase
MPKKKVVVKVLKLDHFDPDFELPNYETAGAAGADVRASFVDPTTPLVIKPGERVLVLTGLAMEIPQGYEIQVRPRSGLSYKTSLMVVNAPGTIDSDYRGEIKVILGNMGAVDQVINHGDRVAQFVLAPVIHAEFEVANRLNDSVRGTRGFGSTGKN